MTCGWWAIVSQDSGEMLGLVWGDEDRVGPIEKEIQSSVKCVGVFVVLSSDDLRQVKPAHVFEEKKTLRRGALDSRDITRALNAPLWKEE